MTPARRATPTITIGPRRGLTINRATLTDITWLTTAGAAYTAAVAIAALTFPWVG